MGPYFNEMIRIRIQIGNEIPHIAGMWDFCAEQITSSHLKWQKCYQITEHEKLSFWMSILKCVCEMYICAFIFAYSRSLSFSPCFSPFLISKGLSFANASDGGALAPGMLPFWTALAAYIITREVPNKWRRIGLAMILFGGLMVSLWQVLVEANEGVLNLSPDITCRWPAPCSAKWPQRATAGRAASRSCRTSRPRPRGWRGRPPYPARPTSPWTLPSFGLRFWQQASRMFNFLLSKLDGFLQLD